MVDPAKLTHVDDQGRVHMVDVHHKAATDRRAVACARVRISQPLRAAIADGTTPKGPILEVARIAGIQAAKRTSELIPLCHGLPLSHADIQAELADNHVELTASVRTHAQTGVEMEALTAVSIAALTLIDMGKAIDRHMVIEEVRLLAKSGGKHDFDLTSQESEPAPR